MIEGALRVRRRIESKGDVHGLAYPWWIPVLSSLAQIICTVIAVIQRDPGWVVVTVPLVMAPHLLRTFSSRWISWRLQAAFVLTALLLLALVPTSTPPGTDLSIGLAAILAADVTVTDGPKAGGFVALASMSLLFLQDIGPWSAVYVGEVVFGMVAGYMMRWQGRALLAERQARVRHQERAALAERQRIAHEIHDLVAHSLSVTMLHVTGARRALSEHGDVDEAVDALIDAERIGRQAMADIRRTVGLLAAEPADARPLPGAHDIEAMVTDVRAAGLKVDYAADGDLTRLGPSAGLGLYRVAQESLANVAKHAPGAPARVRVEVDGAVARLRVSNPLTRSTPSRSDGSGLTGMTARARQLGGEVLAASQGREWVVELAVPVDGATNALPDEPADAVISPHACVLRRFAW